MSFRIYFLSNDAKLHRTKDMTSDLIDPLFGVIFSAKRQVYGLTGKRNSVSAAHRNMWESTAST